MFGITDAPPPDLSRWRAVVDRVLKPEGQVKIVLPSDSGEEALLTVLNEGDFFGELSLIDGQPRSATIVTTAPTETVVLHREDFLNFLRTSPEVGIDMLRVLASGGRMGVASWGSGEDDFDRDEPG